MERKKKQLLCCLLIVFLFSSVSVSAAQTEEVEIDEPSTELTTEDMSGNIFEAEGDASLMSIANPKKASLKVNTNSYGCPSPNTGYVQETVPANTDVWVVEKSYCSAVGKYYYYAGYTYNNASHRGYFSEDNVYVGTSRLLPANVTAETKPANLKEHTLAGTVYDGPATTYSQTGSVGQESVKLIRTEGDYNFIEYKVDANGRYKRGFLHYSKITGEWATLTSQTKNALDGKTFYLKNTGTGQYMDLKTWSNDNNTKVHQWEFHGDTNQIFKFVYNSSGRYYTIQPVNAYSVNRKLTVQSISGTEHADRQLILYNNSTQNYQKFWVVRTSPGSVTYKIVPVSSYGTMTLTNRGDSTDSWVKQYYTDTTNNGRDIWRLDHTNTRIVTTWYGQSADRDMCCWAYAAKMAVSAFYNLEDRSIDSGIAAVKGSIINEPGNIYESQQISNYFFDENKYGNHYIGFNNKIYSSSNMRKFIHDGYPLQVALQPSEGIGHMITIIGYEWRDIVDGSLSPGYYAFNYYDSLQNALGGEVRYNELINGTNTIIPGSKWKQTVAFATGYVNNTADAD